MQEPQIKILSDPKAVTIEAANRIVASAKELTSKNGQFSIALSGGSTPKSLYELLAAEPYRPQMDWPKVEIFFGDERSVPPEDAQSNYRMAKESLLDRVPIPSENVHRMKGELDSKTAAIEYGRMLKARFGDGGCDLALLGMGDDGHTASLFPHTEALKETHHRCLANHVPQMNTWRITMSASFINKAREILILVTGAGKSVRLKEVLHGPQEPTRLPIQLIRPASGNLTWLLDKPAASAL